MREWLKGLKSRLLKWIKSLSRECSNELEKYPLAEVKTIGILTDDEIEEQANQFFRENV
jgi:hypothetical protein